MRSFVLYSILYSILFFFHKLYPQSLNKNILRNVVRNCIVFGFYWKIRQIHAKFIISLKKCLIHLLYHCKFGAPKQRYVKEW